MPKDKLYLLHIVDSINKIQLYTSNVSEQGFIENEMMQDAVIRKLEIIGEAVKKISNKLKKENQVIPWRDIAGMRDKLIHDYFGVDIEKVWLTIVDDLPKLKESINKIISSN